MTIVILFLISTALAYISIEPLRIIGILLSLCYLPGLSFFSAFKREKLLLEDLLLAFPTSVGLSGLLTVLLLFLGVPVSYIVFVVQLIVGAVLVFCLIARNNNKDCLCLELDRREINFLLFAFLLTLLLSIPFFIGPNKSSIAAHAFHHSSFVSQVLNGIFPPENPGLGATMIGYYWGFHAFVAAITANTDYHQLQVIFSLNVLSLFMIMAVSYRFGKALDLDELYCYMLPLGVIGLMRCDAVFFLLYNFLLGEMGSVKSIMFQHEFVLPNSVLTSWMGGMKWLDTRLFFINKFYNISAMPMAVSLCLAYMLILLLSLKDAFRDKKIYSISSSIIIMASVLYYPPLAVFPLIFTPVWTCYLFLSTPGSFSERLKGAQRIFLPYLIGVLVAFPYIFYILASRDSSSSGQGSIFVLDIYTQSIKNIVVYLLPFLVIAAGVRTAFKKLSFSRELCLLMIASAVCLALTLFTRWPFDNSYKYNYILVFFFSVFFVFALSGFLPLLSRLWRKFIITFTLLLLLSNPLLVEAAFIVSCLSMDWYVNYSGKHLIFAHDEKKNEAYKWARENTPVDALIMLSYVETRWPCCGFSSNYYVPAITERNLYAIRDEDYTVSNPDYAKRVQFREKLFVNPEDPAVIDFFSKLNRPLYLLIDDDLDRRMFFVDERFDVFPPDLSREFVPVFQNERQRVYRISFDK